MTRWGAYLELTKPRLTFTALLTTLLGLLAARLPLTGAQTACALLGAALVGGGANALNQYFERDVDALMKRTERRPLPSGRLKPFEALVFAYAATAAGTAILWAGTTPLAAALGLATVILYAFVYTPLKRLTTLNTYVGAVPGALPVVIGWTAAGGRLDAGAAALFALLFFWQLPHFYSIAWIYRDDYARGGLKMVTATDTDGWKLGWRILLTSIILVPAALSPVYAGVAGEVYFLTTLTLGVVFVTFAFGMIVFRMQPARGFMAASIVYLCAMIVVMIADRA